MTKRFNTTGLCIPGRHFMVRANSKIGRITQMVQEGHYFIINRPRQYGKTTTLNLLRHELINLGYLPILISFEKVGLSSYVSEEKFIKAFLSIFRSNFIFLKEEKLTSLIDENSLIEDFPSLSFFITSLVSRSFEKMVLMIDEVDKSHNNQLFLDFLGMLRDKYLAQASGLDYTFHCVVLSGLRDVKNFKQKLSFDEVPTYNSPWNIAINFDVDLAFNPEEIATMLIDYQETRGVAIDIHQISKKLHYYTSGYPFLVSRICQLVDEVVMDDPKKWEETDLEKAIQLIVQEQNTNFASLIQKLIRYPNLYQTVINILLDGIEKKYNPHQPTIQLGVMYGILNKSKRNKIKVHNRIYEQIIYDYLISNTEMAISTRGYNLSYKFIEKDGNLNVKKILLKFQEFINHDHPPKNQKINEEDIRLVFLAFINPVINDEGYRFIEVQSSEEKRLNVIITYKERRFALELKFWYGAEVHQESIQDFSNYLQKHNLNEGYLIIFDERNDHLSRQETIQVEEKELFTVWINIHQGQTIYEYQND